nr:DUF898 family protein [uncultured Tyzzerella sp.]
MSDFSEFNNNSSSFERPIGCKLQLTGSPLGYIGYTILVAIGSGLTLGILYPFLMSRLVRWCVQNTTYNGRNLRFVGSSVELYVKIIIFGLLGLITFGIGFLFYGYYFVKWIIENIVVD